ncbi:MAG TPA: pectinesterase family protein, partial [Opitutales bacterium]|nr:pectinesterase family protein [Opitutales bacterium]
MKLPSFPRLVVCWLIIAANPLAAQPALGTNGISYPIGPASALTGGVPGPRFPADQATNVNPDTHLFINFNDTPTLGASGQIRIYDAANDQVVDTLDLSIPPGPRGAARGVRGPAAPSTTPPAYQLNIIGGFKEGFHFYPVFINDHTATIYPHNNVLTYGKTYYVQIDPGVLTLGDGSFTGISGKTGWTFSTKKAPPAKDATRLVVAADGSGDFNTVQGAVDFTADKNEKPVTLFIKKGTYEEIVYFRNKTNLTFLGEDRQGVLIGYPNNENFNGAAPGTKTNETPDTFPYRRVAFMGDHSSGIHIVNLTLENFNAAGGQCEALLLMGGQNIVSHVNLLGHTDTLQFNDSVYATDCHVEGTNDFIWGRGPAFFNNCNFKGLANGPFMWVRSTSASHGFVFANCQFTNATPRPNIILARNPAGGTPASSYPNSEVVLLDCAVGDFSPALWSLGGDTSQMHYWEFHTTNLADGQPA